MRTVLEHIKASRTLILILLTPLLLLPVPLVIGSSEARCAYALFMMAVFWITESVPISVTALMPVFLFPILNVMTASATAKEYITETIMMGIGALQVAIGIENWNLHKRIALRILLFMGSEPRWLMLGLMLATWFLSMWISNTATTTMMIPITEAILQQLKTTTMGVREEEKKSVEQNGTKYELEMTVKVSETDDPADKNESDPADKQNSTTKERQPEFTADDKEEQRYERLCKGMSLCICYAANCGGIATLTGTGPNLIMKAFADDLYEQHGLTSPVNFASWMGFGLPLSALMLIVTWCWLQIFFLRCRGAFNECSRNSSGSSDGQKVKQIIRNEYDKLGPISFAEGSMLFWFAMMVVLWISRDLGGMGGWQNIFPEGTVSGSTVSVLIAFILYFYPSTPPAIFCGRRRAEKHSATTEVNGRLQKLEPLLTWKVVHEKMPWGLILLLGGGFALAKGCQESGLSLWIGQQFEVFSHLNRYVILFIICYIAAATTEVTSNSAISSLFVPILSSLAISTGVHPLYYLFPGVISCSFAYMLPVATPPNAIVFSYGHVRIVDMMSAGVVLNILAVPLLVFATATWGEAMFNFQNIPEAFVNATILANAI
ncbi:hypothetical protein BaRGS_00035646 [Batillaria attramentaria]|uniref:Solute carrier family 13 member 5 n=1 Tax=Batillaria attramentaria TaxID=370345 RepID=A0ABD0JE83_9CAEN